jgi:hypothetical protein
MTPEDWDWLNTSQGRTVAALRLDQSILAHKGRPVTDILAEYFIRGIQAGADNPELAGDGRDMYEAFKEYHDAR